MRVSGITLALLDMPSAYTQEYNRWYDLDHMPEHVSKEDVLAGRRYVAPRALRSVEGAEPSPWAGGYPPYATIYFFGGPLDFMDDRALAGWQAKDREIVKAGRFWREGRVVHTSRWRLAAATGRPSLLVSAEAMPYVAHRGIVVCAGRAPSPDRVDEAIDWWDRVRLVDLFAVAGVLAALRFEPVEPAPADSLLHLLLCEDPPADVMRRLAAAERYQRAVGRYPAHGGVYESLARLPYERIVPLEYDFDVGSDDEA